MKTDRVCWQFGIVEAPPRAPRWPWWLAPAGDALVVLILGVALVLGGCP